MKNPTRVIVAVGVLLAGAVYFTGSNPFIRLRFSSSTSSYREASTGSFPNGDGGRIFAVTCSIEDFLAYVAAQKLNKHEGGQWPKELPTWCRAPSINWWKPPHSPDVLYFHEDRNSRTMCAYERGVAYIEYTSY